MKINPSDYETAKARFTELGGKVTDDGSLVLVGPSITATMDTEGNVTTTENKPSGGLDIYNALMGEVFND